MSGTTAASGDRAGLEYASAATGRIVVVVTWRARPGDP
jgi:hypothetical protein